MGRHSGVTGTKSCHFIKEREDGCVLGQLTLSNTYQVELDTSFDSRHYLTV